MLLYILLTQINSAMIRICSILMIRRNSEISRLLNPFLISDPMRYHQSITKRHIGIQTLDELWLEHQQTNSTPSFDKSVSSPSQLYLEILKGLKQNISNYPEFKLAFLWKIQQNLTDLDYLKYLVLVVLPVNNQFPQLNRLYLRIVRNYLQQKYYNNHQNLSFEDIYIILTNLQRLTTDYFVEWDDENWFVNDFSEEQEIMIMLFEPLLKIYEANQYQYDEQLFMRTVRICSVLNVSRPNFSQILVHLLHDPSKRFRLSETLSLLVYLSQCRFFPTEYFYANQRKWIQVIEQYENYAAKKSNSTIKFLKIMISENPSHCERILSRIFCLMESNTLSLDNEQLARQWYAISKARFTLPKSLTSKMIHKISESVHGMKEGELCLLVRGFARLVGKKRIHDEPALCKSILQKTMDRLPDGRELDRRITAEILRSLEVRRGL